MKPHPALKLVVKPSRRRKVWPASPKLPKFDPLQLTPEQSRRISTIAGRSGVAWHPTQAALLVRSVRAFFRIFSMNAKADVGQDIGSLEKGR